MEEKIDAIDVEARLLELGPTGRFPDGKLMKDDDGEIKISVAVVKNVIVLDFGTPILWLGLPPDSADRLAECLKKRVQEIREAQA